MAETAAAYAYASAHAADAHAADDAAAAYAYASAHAADAADAANAANAAYAAAAHAYAAAAAAAYAYAYAYAVERTWRIVGEVQQQKIVAEFRRLKTRATAEGWTDKTPVPPSVFDDPVPSCDLTVQLQVPPGMSAADATNWARRLALAVDREQRRLGGHGLAIRKLELEQEAGVPAEAPR